MSTVEFDTLQQALDWATHEFEAADLYFGHGTDNAWDEAIWLSFCTLGIPYNAEPSVLEMVLDETQQEMLLTVFRRRISERIPAAYLNPRSMVCGTTILC